MIICNLLMRDLNGFGLDRICNRLRGRRWRKISIQINPKNYCNNSPIFVYFKL